MSEKIEDLFQRNKREKNEGNLENYLEKNIERLFGVVQLTRHADTHYTNVYPDITEEGVGRAKKTGAAIKEQVLELGALVERAHLSLGQDLLFFSSPSPRAQSTCKEIESKLKESISEEIRIVDLSPNKGSNKNGEIVRAKNIIRQLDFKEGGQEEIEREMMKLVGVNSKDEWNTRDKKRKTDYEYTKDDFFEKRDDLMETRTQARERMFRGLASKTKVLKRYKDKFSRIPHVVAVSHFELLNQLVSEVFDLSDKEADDELLHRAEKISIYMLDSGDKDRADLVIEFRGKLKRVFLNLKEKQFEKTDESNK